MGPGVHVPLRMLRAVVQRGITVLKSRFAAPQTVGQVLEPVYAKVPHNAHLHPAIRQRISGRWYSTSAKNILRFAGEVAPRATRQPAVRAAVAGRLATPFASTLRPTLTGGAIPRSTMGYSLGGGARFFSHSPAAPAQVFSQVSHAMRAFVNSGKGNCLRQNRKMGPVSVRAQLAASLAQQDAPGAYIDFDLSPTMTCISPLSVAHRSLGNVEFLENLTADFDAMMATLIAVNADIRSLSTLGDLPVSLVGPAGSILRVHFRGCDGDFVETLCGEVGVKRGIVHEDERFTFGMLAPGSVTWEEMMSDSLPLSSTYSEDGFEDEIKSRITGSESVDDMDYYFDPADRPVMLASPGLLSSNSSGDYGGLVGIYRFLGECDEYRSRPSIHRH